MRSLFMSLILACSAVTAGAQAPVYRCADGTYTDQPCKGGREVDIAPTRGAHSMSGRRRESTEAILDNAQQRNRAAHEKGLQEAQNILRCQDLRRRRQALDRGRSTEALDGERRRIREQQFALKCRRP